MIVWRLAPRRHAEALDGAGNRDTGARWNSGRGRGVVYASASLSTCVLEAYVHLGSGQRMNLPKVFRAVKIELPDDAGILRIAPGESPRDADRVGRDGRTWRQRRGDQWLKEGKDLVLIAPSAVVPQELNVMLNPRHPRMADVKILSCDPFRFDPRLASPAAAFGPRGSTGSLDPPAKKRAARTVRGTSGPIAVRKRSARRPTGKFTDIKPKGPK